MPLSEQKARSSAIALFGRYMAMIVESQRHFPEIHQRLLHAISDGTNGYEPEYTPLELASYGYGENSIALSVRNAVWMCARMINDPEVDTHKLHRWLGYVQAMVILHGLQDLDEVRDDTRFALCEHDWKDMRNNVVVSGEFCPKCRAIRPGNATIDSETKKEPEGSFLDGGGGGTGPY